MHELKLVQPLRHNECIISLFHLQKINQSAYMHHRWKIRNLVEQTSINIISTIVCHQFVQKMKNCFEFYNARRRRRFFGGIFGMRNFGLNFPPPYFFKKVVRRGGGELPLIPLIESGSFKPTDEFYICNDTWLLSKGPIIHHVTQWGHGDVEKTIYKIFQGWVPNTTQYGIGYWALGGPKILGIGWLNTPNIFHRKCVHFANLKLLTGVWFLENSFCQTNLAENTRIQRSSQRSVQKHLYFHWSIKMRKMHVLKFLNLNFYPDGLISPFKNEGQKKKNEGRNDRW